MTAPDPRRRLAILVLSHERRDDTLACLASLRGVAGPGDAVVVVDNGSTDGTAGAVAREHPWATLVRNEENAGCAAGLNDCLRWALERGYPWGLLLSEDTVVQRGAVAALLAHGEAHPEAGAVQALLLSHADPGRIDTLGLAPRRFLGATAVGEGRPVAEAPGEPRPVFGISFAAALVRMEAVRDTGLLDEELYLLSEDIDWFFRLRARGHEVHLCPAATVLHRRGISGPPKDAASARTRKFWLQRGAVALALKYWPLPWLLLSLPSLLWRMLQARRLAGPFPDHPPGRLWRRYFAERAAARKAMAEGGVDRWFA